MLRQTCVKPEMPSSRAAIFDNQLFFRERTPVSDPHNRRAPVFLIDDADQSPNGSDRCAAVKFLG